MAYKPTVWVDGKTPVNAENLNKMERGIADAVVSVNGITPDENGNVAVAGGSGSNVDLTGYATEQYVQDYAQPKGNYLTEHQDISGKLDASALPTAINTALAQAKASGEFDGKTPVKGTDYFTAADKAEMVADVKEALENNEIAIHTMTGGYYATDGSIISEPTYTGLYTDMIPVSKGEKFNYTGLGIWGATSVLWYNETNAVIGYEQYGEWRNPATVVVTVPSGVTYARFCSFDETGREVLEVSKIDTETASSILFGKKIAYDGDSICYGAGYTGGYAKLIAEKVGGTYDNQAVGGARLVTKGSNSWHSVVDNLPNLPTDADLYCFNGGINDYWTPNTLGTFDYDNFDGELDTTTVCGALETIFRYCLNNFVGKPVCFVITHKIQKTAYKDNAKGDSFKDYHDAMVGICEKYSIPYYDAFSRSGLNGWNAVHNQVFFTDGDGSHPTEEAYKRYYVPQLISLFESIMPEDVSEPELPDVPTDPEAPTEPTYTNLLDEAGYKSGVYLSNGNENADANAYTTGFMDVGNTGYIYLKNVTLPNESSHGNRVALYNADKQFLAQVSVTASLAGWEAQFDSNGNLIKFYFEKANTKYMRISSWGMDETSIITINEPID